MISYECLNKVEEEDPDDDIPLNELIQHLRSMASSVYVKI